eukprot:scaffold323220_cov55-Attheya_sp.AAC.2
MPIILHRVIARVQNGAPSYFEQEHGRSQHVPRIEGMELEPAHRYGLMVVNEFDLVHAALQFGFRVQDVGRCLGCSRVSSGVSTYGGSALLDIHEAEVVP